MRGRCVQAGVLCRGSDAEPIARALARIDWAIDRMREVIAAAQRGEDLPLGPEQRGLLALLSQLAYDCSVMARVVANCEDESGGPESTVRRLRALAAQLRESGPDFAGGRWQ